MAEFEESEGTQGGPEAAGMLPDFRLNASQRSPWNQKWMELVTQRLIDHFVKQGAPTVDLNRTSAYWVDLVEQRFRTLRTQWRKQLPQKDRHTGDLETNDEVLNRMQGDIDKTLKSTRHNKARHEVRRGD